MISPLIDLLQKLVLSSLCLLVCSCASQTQVHVFTTHLNEEQATKVINQLNQHNFKVHENKLAFPESINSNALVYTPSTNENNRISELVSIINNLGYNLASTHLIFEGNHSFTMNNVGLYLLPEGVVKPAKNYTIQLLNEYGSTTCEHATNLYLKEGNQFKIEINQWDEKNQQYHEMNIVGKWTMNDTDTLLLTNENWSFPLAFFRQESIKNTKHGPRQVVSLLPTSEQVDKAQSAVNCTYTISVVI